MGTARRLQPSPEHSNEAGFSLVEVVVALTLTVVVMTATAAFFVRGVSATRLMQQRQAAVGVAAQVIEGVRSEPPEDLAARDDADSGATNANYRVANVNYVVRTVVASCALPPGGATCDADPADPANMPMYRVTVTVTWTPGLGAAQCSGATGTCHYTVTTLRDPSARTVSQLREVRAT